jgi:hypothetical protein
MITKFKIFENSNTFNIGDYVITVEDYIGKPYITKNNASGIPYNIWVNICGEIVNIEKNNSNLYLFRPVSILSNEQKKFILSQNKYNYDRKNDTIPFEDYDFWINDSFLFKIKTKKEFNEFLSKVNMMYKVDKYNL